MSARVSATISTERRVGIGAVVCCRAAAKEYRHGKGLCDRAPMWQLFAALIFALCCVAAPCLNHVFPAQRKSRRLAPAGFTRLSTMVSASWPGEMRKVFG